MVNIMSFGSKLKRLREDKGLTQKDISKASGVSQGSISQLENNGRKFTQESVNKILESLGITEEDFFSTNLTPVEIPGKGERLIPVISWVSAGRFIDCVDVWPDCVSGEDEPVHVFKTVGKKAFGLRVNGDSMEPRFMAGDIIIVDPDIHPENGNFCVVWLNGDVSFRIFHENDQEIRLESMNNKYPEFIIKRNSRVDFRIIGKVVDMVVKKF